MKQSHPVSLVVAMLLHLLSGDALSQNSMEALSEAGLSDIHARDGVALEVEFRANADANGQPLASVDFCSGQNNPCRLGLEFEGREGQWMVLKDYYYVLRYDNILLDAGATPNSDSPYRDLTRFEDGAGLPLLLDPNDVPALQVSFPAIAEGQYSHAYVALRIGRLAAEYDSNLGAGVPCELPACTPGYMRDENPGSVLGFAIGNSAGGLAGIRMDGVMRAFGF